MYITQKEVFNSILGKNRKSDNGETSHRIFGQFEVRREQPLQQQLSAVSALLVAVPPPMVNTKRQEHVKTYNVGHRQDIFIPLREQLRQQRI